MDKKIKRVLIPGSFDPVTIGHYDVIKRCADIFDEVYVVVFQNTEKKGKGIFSGSDCLEMLKIAVRSLENVYTDITDTLVVDYAKEKNVDFIVKGVRDTIDFEYEYGLFAINRSIGDYDTIFIPSLPEYKHISSTFVRDMIKYGRDITPYVPDGVAEYIETKK
ncbi:MAG: pantetheine-phosphate adenylyltransferase [Ruminococcaceae bacterium]|nr:pantetheine-phosphate adenylyltransferase [Oscillospiraceae bacterium]